MSIKNSPYGVCGVSKLDCEVLMFIYLRVKNQQNLSFIVTCLSHNSCHLVICQFSGKLITH